MAGRSIVQQLVGLVMATNILVLSLGAISAYGIDLKPGDKQPPKGTTAAADPSLAGEVIFDQLRPFRLQTKKGLVFEGTIQDRVVRSQTRGTLDFYLRVIPTPNAALGGEMLAIERGSFRGFPNLPLTAEVDYGTDGDGDVAPTLVSRAEAGETVAYIFNDSVQAGKTSLFMYYRSTATAFDQRGLARLFSIPGSGTDADVAMITLPITQPIVPQKSKVPEQPPPSGGAPPAGQPPGVNEVVGDILHWLEKLRQKPDPNQKPPQEKKENSKDASLNGGIYVFPLELLLTINTDNWPRIEQDVKQLLKDKYNVEITEVNDLLNLGIALVRIRFANFTSVQQVPTVEQIRQEIRTKFSGTVDLAVDFNLRYRLLGNISEPYRRAIGLERTSAPPRTISTVRVGILDTDVDPDNVAFKHQTLHIQHVVTDRGASDSRHGTAVASLIVGRDSSNGFAGVVPGADLYVAHVVAGRDEESWTRSDWILQGLNWLRGNNVRVINISCGLIPDQSKRTDENVANRITQLFRGGIAFVGAAGNSSRQEVSFPASLPEVIAVAQTVVTLLGDPRISAKSSPAGKDKLTMIAAPAEGIWVPMKREGHIGWSAEGTSFAAPQVTGAVAWLFAEFPTLNPIAAWDALCSSAKDIGPAGHDSQSGCGLLQVKAAVAKVRSAVSSR